MALGDFETWIVSREDLILSKLYWASDSKSELQLRDVKNLLTVDCDMPYLYSRAEDLGVKALFLPEIGFAGRWGFCEVMNDTDPQIAKLVRSRLLERSGAERILMGSRMFDVAKTIMLASFPEGLTEIEIKARLCERLYGDEVDVSAFLQHLRSLQPDPSAE